MGFDREAFGGDGEVIPCLAGFRFVRQEGSHRSYVKEGVIRPVVIPTYDEVPVSMVADPEVMLGKPVIRGTRITVELILEKLAAGETVEQIVGAHPRLTPEAVFAALAFAAESMKAEVAQGFRGIAD